MSSDDTYINNTHPHDRQLLRVSSGCVINNDYSPLTGHKYVEGKLIFGLNTIRESTEVQPGAVLWAGSVTGPNVTLGPGSFQTTSVKLPSYISAQGTLTPGYTNEASTTHGRVWLQGCPAVARETCDIPHGNLRPPAVAREICDIPHENLRPLCDERTSLLV